MEASDIQEEKANLEETNRITYLERLVCGLNIC